MSDLTRNTKILNNIAMLAFQVDIDVCDNNALWDDAQDFMEQDLNLNPQGLERLAEIFDVLSSRAKERAQDIRDEDIRDEGGRQLVTSSVEVIESF